MRGGIRCCMRLPVATQHLRSYLPEDENLRSHSSTVDRTASSDSLASRLAASMVTQTATLSTLDGRVITSGMLQFGGSPLAWEGTLDRLSQPGVLAARYFAEGLRDVIVALEDGRRARARILSTEFRQGSERVCALVGTEQLR